MKTDAKSLGMIEFRAGKPVKDSFILTSREKQRKRRVWVARILLKMKICGRRTGAAETFKLLQYVELTAQWENVHEFSGCICVSCSTYSEMNIILRV